MKNLESAWYSLRSIDELAFQQSIIHSLPSVIKLLTTLVFLVFVVSFPKYELVNLIAMLVYPVLMMFLADLPLGFLVKQMLVMAAFVFCVAIFNPFFDHGTGLTIGTVVITRGWISFGAIMLKFVLTALSSLVLIATTGIEGICTGLVRLGCPRVLVLQLLLVYRYIMVLMEEAARMIQAYYLRSLTGKGICYRAWGSLLGQFLLRTLERAERIYQAMRCRGFNGELRLLRDERWTSSSLVFLVGWVSFFLSIRFYNLPYVLGEILVGVSR